MAPLFKPGPAAAKVKKGKRGDDEAKARGKTATKNNEEL